MKKHQALALGLALTAGSVLTTVQPVMAQENQTTQSQEQKLEMEQDYEIECETSVGPYGQGSSTCYVKSEGKIVGEQTQEQTADTQLVYVDGQPVYIKEHVPVDTALDFKSFSVVASAVLAGVVASVVKFKQRFA
jgi:hypothetical protein